MFQVILWWPIWIKAVTLLLQRLKTIDDPSNDQDANQLIMMGQLFQNKIKGQVKKLKNLSTKITSTPTILPSIPSKLPCKVSGPKQSHQVQVWMAWNHPAVQRQLCSKLNLKVAEDLPCVFAGVVLKNKKVMSSSLVFRSWHKIKFIRKFLYRLDQATLNPPSSYNFTMGRCSKSMNPRDDSRNWYIAPSLVVTTLPKELLLLAASKALATESGPPPVATRQVSHMQI